MSTPKLGAPLVMIGLFMTLAHPVKAEWTTVSTRADGDVLYADRATLKASGPIVSVASLLAYSKQQLTLTNNTFNSSRTVWELNCQSRTYRTLSFTAHADTNGTGDAVINETTPSNWGAVPETSIPGDIYRWACR